MKKKGFTLIEMVIVISILAILALLIVPKLINTKQSAAKSVNNHNMYILQEELENYRAKNDTYPIASNTAGLLTEFKNSSGQTIFLSKLPTYKSGKEVINTYKCSKPGTTYSVTFNDDPSTTIDEGDDTKYNMDQDTNTNNLFK